MLRVCLSSVTFLARNARMSGISAQQYVRAKEGLIVAQHREGDKDVVEVIKNGNVINQYPGDVIGCAAIFIFAKIWGQYRRSHTLVQDYLINPAFSFLNSFNVDRVLGEVDLVTVKEQLVPALKQSEDKNYTGFATKYDTIMQETVPKCQKLMLYDWLVRLFCYIREHSFNLDFINWSRLHPVPILEALKHLAGVDCVILREENDPLLPAVTAVYPNGVRVERDGKWFYVCDKSSDVLSIIGGRPVQVLDVSFDGVADVPCVKGNRTEKSKPSHVAFDQDLLNELSRLIEIVLQKPVQALNEVEREFLEFPRRNNYIGPGGIGQNALKGLSSIAGVGPIPEVLARAAVYLCGKSTFSNEVCLRIAAARLATMQSARQVVVVDGVPWLEVRDNLA